MFSSSSTPFLLFGAFVLSAVFCTVYEGTIRPMLISHTDILLIADNLVRQYGDRAEEIAFIEEDAAWRRSKTFEQGKWRRVRRELKLRRDHSSRNG